MDYSRCFPEFKMVYIFLKYFFQNISQMTLNVYSISVKNKTTSYLLVCKLCSILIEKKNPYEMQNGTEIV